MTSAAELFDRLTRLGDYERRARDGTLHMLLAELDAGKGTLDGDPLGESLRALHRALRIDLAFLVEHPEATFHCLHHRCVWHGTEDGIELPLHRAMRRWLASKEAGRAPWLRSLRAPEIALDGGLLEEYRCEAPEYLRHVRFGHGERHVELLVRTAERGPAPPFAKARWTLRAWDRETGKQLEGGVVEQRTSRVSPDGRLRVENDGWGDARLRGAGSDAIVRTLPFSDSYLVSAVGFSADGRRVALAGWSEEMGGFLQVLDVETGAELMDIHVDSALFEVALSPRGDRVAASGTRRTTVWEVAGGSVIQEYPLRRPALGFSADGKLLLTAELGVVRVWDLDTQASIQEGYRDGLSNAAFSPNGERLVTGSWLHDAVSGAPIAHLDFVRGQYLEGGPPSDAFMLADTKVVSLERGVEVWDARTGARLVRDYDRRYSHLDHVAISPDGSRYAVTRAHRSGAGDRATVTVLGVADGKLWGALDWPAFTSMAWSPDGRHLFMGGVDGSLRMWVGARVYEEAAGPPLAPIYLHKSAIVDLVFLPGSEKLVAVAEGEELYVWDDEAHRRSTPRPPGKDVVVTRYLANRGLEVRTWRGPAQTLETVLLRGQAEIVEAVRRWLGEPGAVPWRVEARNGSMVWIDADSGAEIAWMPASEELRRHPREPIWAGGPVHVKLEV